MSKIFWITEDSYLDCDHQIVRELSRRHTVYWLVFASKGNTIDPKILSIPEESPNVLVRVVQLGYRYRNPLVIFTFLSELIRGLRFSASLKFVNMGGKPFFHLLLRLLISPKQAIIATHNVTTPKGASDYRAAVIYQKLVMLFYIRYLVFSPNQLLYSKRIYPNKEFFMVPLALKDFGIPTQTKSGATVVFLFFGYIREYKRLDLLIQAACEVYLRTRIPFKVKICGYTSDFSKYENLMKVREIFEVDVRKIPDSEVPDIFATSDFFVQPYQDLAQSGALRVANNYLIPCIASSIEAFTDEITDGDNGYIFEKNSQSSLENALERALAMTVDEYAKMRMRIQDINEQKYTPQCIANLYSDIFDRIEK